MAESYKCQATVDSGRSDSTTWARVEHDGRLVIEFYDFSDAAEAAFGNDVAYFLIVAAADKPLVLAKLEANAKAPSTEPDADRRLVELFAQQFDSYFTIQSWMSANEIPFTKEFDGWA